MEQNEFGTLPPEIWSLVLSHLEDFHDLINLKIVNRIFCNELTTRDPLRAISSELENSKAHLSFLRNRDTSYALSRKNLQQIGSFAFKTIVVGAVGVGKSIMISSFVRGRFDENRYPTIGSYYQKTFVDPDGIKSTVTYWDSMGQERYMSLPKAYYRGAHAVFLCFSIDDKQSLISLIDDFVPGVCDWLKTVRPEEWPVMYLLGLKSDLENERQVSTNIGKALARVLKVKYFECSSKLSKNLSEMMHEIKDDLLKAVRVPKNESVLATSPSNTSASRWCSIQ